ncbi:hypothetical protein B0H17DRAFT_561071 [Mycena rosella]|uniref:CCHC-type domain-containing protein n=1 Tax=Mycena rosella TaxID=1033263 RepID=A0AAD7BP19_MYCRO|nr:hypothetical protein B0H17DRAFT_561071 [Mycena rosella]
MCFRCGERGHGLEDCPHPAKCYECGQEVCTHTVSFPLLRASNPRRTTIFVTAPRRLPRLPLHPLRRRLRDSASFKTRKRDLSEPHSPLPGSTRNVGRDNATHAYSCVRGARN